MAFPWYLAKRISRSHNAVTEGQTWVFTDDFVLVTNNDKTEIRSAWSKIVKTDECDGYLLLVTSDGSCSPIPMDLLGKGGRIEMIEKIKNSPKVKEMA